MRASQLDQPSASQVDCGLQLGSRYVSVCRCKRLRVAVTRCKRLRVAATPDKRRRVAVTPFPSWIACAVTVPFHMPTDFEVRLHITLPVRPSLHGLQICSRVPLFPARWRAPHIAHSHARPNAVRPNAVSSACLQCLAGSRGRFPGALGHGKIASVSRTIVSSVQHILPCQQLTSCAADIGCFCVSVAFRLKRFGKFSFSDR